MFAKETVYGYQYDRINRLVSADALVGDIIDAQFANTSNLNPSESYSIGDEDWGYDRIGNIIGQYKVMPEAVVNLGSIVETFAYTYANGTNRLTKVEDLIADTARNYTYDANGNLLTDDFRDIDATSYMRGSYPHQVTQSSDDSYYLYDGGDQRIFKKVVTLAQTTQEMYIKDALGRDLSIVKFTTVGSTTAPGTEYFVYGTDRVARVTVGTTTPLAKIQPDEATYFLYDHLGNNRVAFQVDASNVPLIINATDYYSYGKILREYDNGAGDRYLTTGHERDQKTGLDYKGARYYDSDISRFLSLDPMAIKYPSLSAYNYVAGNPIIFVDPDGCEIRDSEGNDISTKKHERQTRWTENHVLLNETFGDPNEFNSEVATSPEWASGMGYKVHQQANFAATYNRYYGSWKAGFVVNILNEATVYADGGQFQTSRLSYRHGMRAPKQSVEKAKELSDEFVRSRYERARNYYEKGEYRLAYYNLGVALHTLQDATSPVHKGFQVWDEHSSKWSQYKHGMSETIYNHDSNLQKVTNWFIDTFEKKQNLPVGNIFDLEYFK